MIPLKDSAVGVAAVVLVAAVAWVVQLVTRRKVKNPAGRRTSLVSLQVTVAGAIVIVLAAITKEPVVVLGALALLLALCNTEESVKRYHRYQLIGSASLGAIVGLIAWWFIDTRANPSYPGSIYDRPDMGAPRDGMDMRHLADGAGGDYRIEGVHPAAGGGAGGGGGYAASNMGSNMSNASNGGGGSGYASDAGNEL